MMKWLVMAYSLSILVGCKNSNLIKPLPLEVSNNAVALVNHINGPKLYSFNGLEKGKTWKNITNNAYAYRSNGWKNIPIHQQALPVLASTAVSIGSSIYVIGGYTVNAKGEEKSLPNIFEFDTAEESWKLKTTMPIPVDDTVALVYANRYIYLISGWHDVNNVSDVQVYDTKNDHWFPATDYPVPPVFGHSGGIVNNDFLICDGVKVVPNMSSRDFVASPVCVQGTINPVRPNKISWQEIPHHSKTAYYRMAATGDANQNRIVFAGGSDNPYNFNGIGYDGIPSKASSLVFTYNFASRKWKEYDSLIPESMDHRALLTDGQRYYIVGGMSSKQQISNKVIQFKVPE